ncbi:MAG: UvrD-helicase domain-containing protein [Spirochaetota bacterium]
MRRDPDQQAAIDVRTNAVVSAGAGSGKTSVLTSRYLRLVVDEHVPVSEILALTFTRKAAAEMYERIYTALAERADDEFVARQLAGFDAATISTLDSFCAAIARNGCSRFGVPATFAIDEQALRSRSEALALAFLTEHAATPAVSDLIRLNGFARLWKDGLARLALEHFRVSDERTLPSYLDEQERFLRGELVRLAGELERNLNAIAALAPDGPKCIQRAQEIVDAIDREAALVDAATASVDLAGLLPPALAQLETISGIKLTCGSSKHADVPLFKELVGELKSTRDRYVLALETLARWDDHVALTHLLEEFRRRVVGEKRRLALLGYSDVTGLAIRTLV